MPNHTETRILTDIVFREDLYPRLKPNPQKIQEYAENLDRLPPIEIDQHNILIDGYHRWKAFETEKQEEIPVIVTAVASEAELECLSVARNATHGQQLTGEEKKQMAIKWWDVLPTETICRTLSISEKTYTRYTNAKQEQKDAHIKQTIYDMWMRCCTPQEIMESVRLEERNTQLKIAEIRNSGQVSDSSLFRNFLGDGTDKESGWRQIYTIWTFTDWKQISRRR